MYSIGVSYPGEYSRCVTSARPNGQAELPGGFAGLAPPENESRFLANYDELRFPLNPHLVVPLP